MALRPLLADIIGQVVTPSTTYPVVRVFIFAEWESEPGFIAIYGAQNGKPILLDRQPITSYTRSLKPRREPYFVTTADNESWSIIKGGCGCGSPIRRVTLRQALDDYAKETVPG